MHRLPAFSALLLLAACGQKGPLYQPDEGVAVTPEASPAVPPAPAAGTGVDGPSTTPAAPTVPASPDRSDEARKRVPRTPSPAESR